MTPENGESVLDANERVLDAWDRLLAGLADETVAVVTHGGPIRMVVGHLAGRDVVRSVTGVEVGNCSLTEVAVDDGEPELVGVGDVVPGAAETPSGDIY